MAVRFVLGHWLSAGNVLGVGGKIGREIYRWVIILVCLGGINVEWL